MFKNHFSIKLVVHKSKKENYKPIITMLNVKAFKEMMNNQLCSYFDSLPDAYNIWLYLYANWGISLDQDSHAEGPLIDLSEMFNCLNHELMIIKLNFYEVESLLSTFLYYLKGRKGKEVYASYKGF